MLSQPKRLKTQVGVYLTQDAIAIAILEKVGDNNFNLKECDYIKEKDEKEKIKKLEAYIKKKKLKKKDCIVVLDEEKYKLIQMPVPLVEKKELKSAIRWNLHDHIDFPVENAVIDTFGMPSNEYQEEKLYVVVSEKKEIQTIVDTIEQSGLNLRVIDVSQLALRNMIDLKEKNKKGIALLTFKKNYGSINLYKDSELYLSRKINIGLEQIDKALRETNDKQEIINTIYEPAILELQRSLDYYETSFYQQPIKKIKVAPGTKNLTDFCEYADQNSGYRVEVIDLKDIFAKFESLDDQLQEQCFLAMASGLRDLEVIDDAIY